jgi:hypothetical protein
VIGNNTPMQREHVRPCDLCGGPLGVTDVYVCAFEQHFFDLRACQQTAGMEMQFGGGAAAARIAAVMSPARDYSAVVSHREVVMCQGCMASKPIADLFFTEEGDRG